MSFTPTVAFSFDPLWISATVLFGLIGSAVLWHEKRNNYNPQRMVIGVALVGLAYFIETGWILWAVSLVLTAMLFINWEK